MIKQDCLRRFLFTELGVRGEWVNLTSSWQTAKQHQVAEGIIQQQLGQALAAVVMLAGTIKFNGSMILQAQGDGAVRTLVAQATHDLKIRGLVRANDAVEGTTLPDLYGEGRLVLTIDQAQGDPYQGIVALEGDNLAAALETYFSQSEQLKTRLWLFANETHAAGLLLQELPAQQHFKADWERIEILADTITEAELLTLDAEQVLHRLFHEEQVRLFDPEAVVFQCACSRARIERTLRALGREELESILHERETIEVDCEFCGAGYVFDRIDTETLLANEGISHESQTKH
jgi:molecular chaperone Hsp33